MWGEELHTPKAEKEKGGWGGRKIRRMNKSRKWVVGGERRLEEGERGGGGGGGGGVGRERLMDL